MSNVKATIVGGAQWQEVAADRQQHRDTTIAKIQPPIPDRQKLLAFKASVIASGDRRDVSCLPQLVLSEEEITITSANVENLVPKLASGEWSATTVLKAFMRRAALAQNLVNCVTEMLPETALKRAAELDEYLAVHGKPVGPLHGLPISVKEHIAMKDLDVNGGYISEVGRIAEEDALVLRILRAAGAVFYVRTTEPQSSMHLETSSNIYGETVNPFNTTLTSGGSSGGEGAIIAMRGSVLGVGSDIGGSIRGPAHCNGVFGFKPTTGRLPTLGWFALMTGSEAIHATIGPLSTSLQGLRLFTKTVIDAKPWLHDISLTPIDWRDMSTAFAGRRLKVAVMWNDGVVKPHPPVTRALKYVVEGLKKSNKIELVEWKPWNHDLAWSIIAGLYFCDGGAQVKAALEAAKEPLRPLSHWILKEWPYLKCHDIASLWKACIDRDAYRTKYAELWNDTGVDVILCPVAPGVASKLNTSKYWGYTAQWNLLDYPAVVFPIGDAVSVEKDGDQAIVAQRNDMDMASDADRENWGLWTEHGAEGYANAPLSLQLVAPRYDDEKLLDALEMVIKEVGLPMSTEVLSQTKTKESQHTITKMTTDSSVKQEYDAQAAIYEGYMDRPTGVIERQLFTAALGDCTGLKVLDLGGGTGLKAREAADAGAASVDVIDLSPEMMRVGQEKEAEQVTGRDRRDVLRWFEGDVTRADLLETIPGLRGPYDLVIIAWVFDHAHDRTELEAMWRNAVAQLKPGTGRLIVARNGDPRSPAVVSGRYGIRYADHVPIPGGLKFRDQMIRWKGGENGSGQSDQLEILADYETTALEIVYSGSHEMYDQFGLTDICVQPYEETAVVQADPAFWAQFLENPCLAIVTARMKAEGK